MLEQITSMMGGRAAESLIFSEMTTGASNDIEKASQLARNMVVEFGMSDLGPMGFGPKVDMTEWGSRYITETKISQEMQGQIDSEIKKIMDTCYKQAISILTKLKKKLDLVASELIKKETLESEDFEKIMGSRPAVAILHPVM